MKKILLLIIAVFITIVVLGCVNKQEALTEADKDRIFDLFEQVYDKIEEQQATKEQAKEQAKETIVETKTAPTKETPSKMTTEKGFFKGRYNGDRPTFYFSKNMKSYPKTFQVVVPGYITITVASNNGRRAVINGVIVKQSDVSGRGMAVVVPASYKGTECYVKY